MKAISNSMVPSTTTNNTKIAEPDADNFLKVKVIGKYLNVNWLASFLTIIITFSALLGFIFFKAYCAYQRIPFPISDSGLYIAFFLYSLLIVVYIVILLYLPSLIILASQRIEEKKINHAISIFFYFIWLMLSYIIFYPILLNIYVVYIISILDAISIILVTILSIIKKINLKSLRLSDLIISGVLYLLFLCFLISKTSLHINGKALLLLEFSSFVCFFVLIAFLQILSLYYHKKDGHEQTNFIPKIMTIIIGLALVFSFTIYTNHNPTKSKVIINNILNNVLSYDLRVGGNVPVKLVVKTRYLNKLIKEKLLSYKYDNFNTYLTFHNPTNACLILKTNNGIYVRISKFIKKPIFIQNQYIIYDPINFNKKCTNN